MVDVSLEPDSRRDWRTLERLDLQQLDSPARYYVVDDDLRTAVDTALALGMPLLLTGEPGVGKSSLAAWLAYDLGLAEPLKYRVKSDTKGQELLYEVDYLARMADAQLDESGKARAKHLLPYLRFSALGKSILRTWSRADLEKHRLLEKVWPADQTPESALSVVLIDEIDKAPTDVPNDLLEELRTLSFSVPGLSDESFDIAVGGPRYAGGTAQAQAQALRPVVIITSNAARSLPAPFLRRCVYYHMRFPEIGSDNYRALQEHLNNNVQALVGEGYDPTLAERALTAFEALRRSGLKQPPSTAELLSLMARVQTPGPHAHDAHAWQQIVLSLLVKRPDDREAAKQALDADG